MVACLSPNAETTPQSSTHSLESPARKACSLSGAVAFRPWEEPLLSTPHNCHRTRKPRGYWCKADTSKKVSSCISPPVWSAVLWLQSHQCRLILLRPGRQTQTENETSFGDASYYFFRIQNMKIAPDGTKEYKGAVDVLVKVCKQEGVFALWKGFWPYYFRLGPHTVITFIIMEQLNTAYNRVNGITGGSSL